MSTGDIEFEFDIPDEEYQTAFVLKYGFSINDINESIHADLLQNELIVVVGKTTYANALIQALRDKEIVLLVATASFMLNYDTISITIDANSSLQINVGIVF
jgi:hypothetical protein